jgi:hypothetical protein
MIVENHKSLNLVKPQYNYNWSLEIKSNKSHISFWEIKAFTKDWNGLSLKEILF